jgi:magnesium-transporting ATPase (P-type)
MNLVKNLKAIENLGCVEVLCTALTGVLTDNKLHLTHICNEEIKEVYSLYKINEFIPNEILEKF